MSDTLNVRSTRAYESKREPSPRADRSTWLRRALTGLTVFGFALPVVAYFWFIHQYGANTLWNDDWDDVDLISHSYSHTLSLNVLWTQHDENRIFFPNLIVLLLARTTHFNVLWEEYLSGLMLVVATGLLIWAHKRRSPSTPLFYYCPVAILMLSFVQFTNALWGFQMAWYIVMVALALALFLLDGRTLNWLVLTGAIAAAIVGSLSSLQGLLIWPAGLVLIYLRRRPKTQVIVWVTSAVATGALYIYHFNFGANVSNDSYSYALTHPLAAIEFFFLTIGNVAGLQVPYTPTAHNDGILVLGVVIVAVAIWVAISYGFRRDESGASPVGVALVCFGLLFAATITEGRTLPGWGLSAGIRYSTFDLLILVGCYLALLDRPLARMKGWRWERPSLLIVRTILIVAVCLQVVLGTENGLAGGRSWHQSQLIATDFAVNIDRIPNSVVSGNAIPGFLPDLSFVRQMAQVARAHNLSLFATSVVARYTKEGLPVESQAATSVVGLSDGAKLKGNKWLFASVSTPFGGVTRVEFRLAGGDLRDSLIGIAEETQYGWLYVWNTMTVPDGTYTLESVAYTANGRSTHSKGVVVKVDN